MSDHEEEIPQQVTPAQPVRVPRTSSQPQAASANAGTLGSLLQSLAPSGNQQRVQSPPPQAPIAPSQQAVLDAAQLAARAGFSSSHVPPARPLAAGASAAKSSKAKAHEKEMMLKRVKEETKAVLKSQPRAARIITGKEEDSNQFSVSSSKAYKQLSDEDRDRLAAWSIAFAEKTAPVEMLDKLGFDRQELSDLFEAIERGEPMDVASLLVDTDMFTVLMQDSAMKMFADEMQRRKSSSSKHAKPYIARTRSSVQAVQAGASTSSQSTTYAARDVFTPPDSSRGWAEWSGAQQPSGGSGGGGGGGGPPGRWPVGLSDERDDLDSAIGFAIKAPERGVQAPEHRFSFDLAIFTELNSLPVSPSTATLHMIYVALQLMIPESSRLAVNVASYIAENSPNASVVGCSVKRKGFTEEDREAFVYITSDNMDEYPADPDEEQYSKELISAHLTMIANKFANRTVIELSGCTQVKDLKASNIRQYMKMRKIAGNEAQIRKAIEYGASVIPKLVNRRAFTEVISSSKFVEYHTTAASSSGQALSMLLYLPTEFKRAIGISRETENFVAHAAANKSNAKIQEQLGDRLIAITYCYLKAAGRLPDDWYQGEKAQQKVPAGKIHAWIVMFKKLLTLTNSLDDIEASESLADLINVAAAQFA